MSVAVLGYTASELAGLPGLPSSARKVRARAEREGWPCAIVTRRGGQARVYSLATLPLEVQEVLARQTVRVVTAPECSPSSEDDAVRAPESHLQIATERARLARAVAELVARGVPLLRACEVAAEGTEHAPRSVRRWHDAVRHHPTTEWVVRLLPKWKARPATTDYHAMAWQFLRDDYLRQSKPALRACYRRMVETALANGWTPVPSYHACRRRLEREVSTAERVFRREGSEALSRLYPSQERDASCFRVLEAINGDGHLADVMVLWPDGKRARPMVIGLEDLRSDKVLSVRVDRSENGEVVRLAMADVVREHGVPEHAYFDNGRVWASKEMTGGQLTRYRGKIRPEDPEGLMTALGIEVHWTTPYHGQSKPIERTWRQFVENVSRHPAFEGAYLGSNPTQKPKNYREEKAVPLATFLEVLMLAVREHNARTGRAVHDGRSFDEVFAEGYAAGPIRRVTEAQRRFLYLAADRIRTRSADGALHLFGTRYWADELLQHRGKMVTVRFDPQDLGAGVFVYASNEDKGRFLCHAVAHGKVAFRERAAARDHASARNAFTKAEKAKARAAQRFSAAELARLHVQAAVAKEPLPDPKIIAPIFGLQVHEEHVEVTEPAEQIAKRTANEHVVLEVGRVAQERLDVDRIEDELITEISRVSFSRLAGDRR